jgi:hypothetical protein
MLQDMIIIPESLPLKSRLRHNKRAVSPKPTTAPSRRQNSSKPGRPIVYATHKPAVTQNAKVARQQVKLPQYTIEDLVNESQTGGHNVTPCVRL